MNPRQFEELVCQHFRKLGYQAEMTPYSNDFGIDVFATKGNEKIAVQAKMYGGSTRKINRQMVMELHGAKDYFDCTKAVIATDGSFLADAIVVAEKLKIDIVYLNTYELEKKQATQCIPTDFVSIWEKYIIPLKGKRIERPNGESNEILKVDWSGVTRITSKENRGNIKIEIFKQAVTKLLTEEFVTRDEINQNYPGRASSGVILVLSQVPFFHITETPIGLRYKK